MALAPASERAPLPPRPAEAAGSLEVGLAALRIEALDEERGVAALRLGDTTVDGALDEAVSPLVLRTALARGERVIAQREGGGWLVLGALRTAPTPGVDEADEFHIKARRVHVEAHHEFAVSSGSASFVLRALGQIEILAQDITSRAASVHKIIGRMIRLN